eukprot:gene12943-14935_t
MFPHRAGKCTFATKSTKRAARTDSPIPPHSRNVASQNVSDDHAPLSTVQVGADVVGSRTEISPPTAEIVPPAVVATSTNELSAAQEVAASNSSLPNGNEQCDCMAYRFKKHRKKKCSWKKHVAIGLATATIVAGTVVLATVVADEAEKDSSKDDKSSDPSHAGNVVRSKKMTSEQKGAAAGLAIASVIAGTAALATVVVCDMQDSKKSDDSTLSLSNGVDNAHSNVAAETGDINETGASHAETQQFEPEPEEEEEEEEPESEVEEEEESEEDFEARMLAQGRADLYAALRDAREADAAILRAERQEAQRLQREQCELQQLAV